MWFKVDDQLYQHPKVRRIPRTRVEVPLRTAAFGLWTLCGAYSGDRLSDGFVPEEVAEQHDPTGVLVPALVDAGLWTPDEVDGEPGYRFHDWLDVNPSREEVLRKRAESAARQQRSRARRAGQSAPPPGQPATPPIPGIVTGDVTRDITRESQGESQPRHNTVTGPPVAAESGHAGVTGDVTRDIHVTGLSAEPIADSPRRFGFEGPNVTRDVTRDSRVSHNAPEPDPDPEKRRETRGYPQPGDNSGSAASRSSSSSFVIDPNNPRCPRHAHIGPGEWNPDNCGWCANITGTVRSAAETAAETAERERLEAAAAKAACPRCLGHGTWHDDEADIARKCFPHVVPEQHGM